MSKYTKVQSDPVVGAAEFPSRNPTVQELPDGSGNDAPRPLGQGDEDRFDAG